MDALIIIDMQEDYVGAKRNTRTYPYNAEQLIENINARIADYDEDSIVYVTNKFFWERSNAPKKFVVFLSVTFSLQISPPCTSIPLTFHFGHGLCPMKKVKKSGFVKKWSFSIYKKKPSK